MLLGLLPKIKNYNIICGSPSTTNVVNYRHPNELMKEMDFTLEDKDGCST